MGRGVPHGRSKRLNYDAVLARAAVVGLDLNPMLYVQRDADQHRFPIHLDRPRPRALPRSDVKMTSLRQPKNDIIMPS